MSLKHLLQIVMAHIIPHTDKNSSKRCLFCSTLAGALAVHRPASMLALDILIKMPPK